MSEDISKEKKINKLKLIAKETVDINGIGLYTLGKARKELSWKPKYNINMLVKEMVNKEIIEITKNDRFK